MSQSVKWDTEAEKVGISFGGVRKTKKNQQKWGTALRAVPYGSIWYMPIDIGVGKNGKPENKFKMYYETRDGPWVKDLPFKGTITEEELQNKEPEATR